MLVYFFFRPLCWSISFFVGLTFRGRNFRHLRNVSPLLIDKIFTNKVVSNFCIVFNINIGSIDKLSFIPGVYLVPSQTLLVKFFCESSKQLVVVNYFCRQKAHRKIFVTPLLFLNYTKKPPYYLTVLFYELHYFSGEFLVSLLMLSWRYRIDHLIQFGWWCCESLLCPISMVKLFHKKHPS